MDAAAELGRNPVSKHQIQPEYGDEQADVGRDCRTRLGRPNYQARTRTGKLIFPVQLTTCRIGHLTRLIHVLAICDDHTFTHIYTVHKQRGFGCSSARSTNRELLERGAEETDRVMIEPGV